jgi:serine/threonine protein kinase
MKEEEIKFQYHQVGYNRFFVDERYTDLKPIGDGSYGFCASAVDSISGVKVSIKKIKDFLCDMYDARKIYRELKILKHLNGHENILSICDLMVNAPKLVDDLYIVTNLLESDLERIIRSKQQLGLQHLQYFLYQMLRGLKYVHSANIIHRDLKPSNILVNANCDIVLCDFYSARGIASEGSAQNQAMTEYVVTRWYRAPELLYDYPHYGKPVDIWSIGCIFAGLILQQPMFFGDNPQHQFEVIIAKLVSSHREIKFNPKFRIFTVGFTI